jgi:hypothetical protein
VCAVLILANVRRLKTYNQRKLRGSISACGDSELGFIAIFGSVGDLEKLACLL